MDLLSHVEKVGMISLGNWLKRLLSLAFSSIFKLIDKSQNVPCGALYDMNLMSLNFIINVMFLCVTKQKREGFLPAESWLSQGFLEYANMLKSYDPF